MKRNENRSRSVSKRKRDRQTKWLSEKVGERVGMKRVRDTEDEEVRSNEA